MSRIERTLLVIVAALSGGVIMAVELLGARLLCVTYGGSLAVWAAMIAVTLLSLAAGNFAGGYLADRAPGPVVLGGLLLAASALTALCPHARALAGICHRAFGLEGGALASSSVLFTAPLALLGTTSPFVIRLLCRDGREVGIKAGGVYAVSTLGSVAGTLLTGLWAIPSLGIVAGFRLAAAVAGLAAVAVLVPALRRKTLPGAAIAAAALLIPVGGPRVGDSYTAPDGDRVELKAIRESPHGHLVVLDKGNYRLLVVNGIVQTGIPTGPGGLRMGQGLANRYYQELLPYTVDEPAGKSVLIIGLAGGMTASLLRLHGMEIDAVEIDPAMIEIARKHFSYTGPATAGDGRRFLNECRRQYDFCVIDTYSGDTFPFHLSTLEAFRAARRVLKPGGILALNYIGAPGGGAFASLHRTIGEVFPHRLGIGGEPGEDVQTITLFASDRPIRFNRGWLDLGGPVTGVDPVSADISRLTVAPTGSGAVVLTDDLNPIDSLRADEALRWRVRTARNIGPQALLL